MKAESSVQEYEYIYNNPSTFIQPSIPATHKRDESERLRRDEPLSDMFPLIGL